MRLSQRDYDDPELEKSRNEGPNRRQIIVDRLTGKVSKEEANYRAAKEIESKESCAECEHYLIPGSSTSSCRRVAGIVEGGDTCDLFVARLSEFTSEEGE